MNIPQVLGYGGGRQTVAMCLLAAKGILPRPDHIVIADTGREVQSTWDYLAEYVGPFMEREMGLTVEIAPHSLATKDILDPTDEVLIPVWTSTGVFQNWCSSKWKTDVGHRYLRSQGIKTATTWLGFSLDEKKRAKGPGESPWWLRYPLLELSLTRYDCEQIIDAHGWPLPSKSACYICPNHTNEEWRRVKAEHPDQFAKAVVLDEELRDVQAEGPIFLHHSRVPLAEADLDAPDRKFAPRQCGLGAGCWT